MLLGIIVRLSMFFFFLFVSRYLGTQKFTFKTEIKEKNVTPKWKMEQGI